jgi:FAD synthase
VNLDLADVPKELPEGIFACRARVNGTSYDAAMHHGPRPVFKDTPSCEVHLLDATLEESPDDADIEVVEYLREVRDFASPDELRQQMLRDIDQARAILRV